MSGRTLVRRAHGPLTGGATATALALIGCAAAYYGFVVRPAEDRLHALRMQSIRSAASAREAHPRAPGRVDHAAALLDYIPAASALPDVLESIYGAAEAQGVSLAQGDYRVLRDVHGRLLQYQIVLPVSGTYPQLRKFAAAALAAVPALSLESVRFERQRIDEPVSAARFTFVVYLAKTS